MERPRRVSESSGSSIQVSKRLQTERPEPGRRAPLAAAIRCAIWIAGLGALAAGPALLAQSFVQNPSFEATFNPEWPHYAVGEIPSWSYVGGTGVNDLLSDATGPFHNPGTAVPDRDRIAFKQGGGSLSQVITGLAAGERYWVQFWYDARACCGGTIQSILVKWDGEAIDNIPNVVPAMGAPASYHFRSVPFVPAAGSGTLTLEAVIDGDATALFDAVTIVQRDEGNVVIANPSFEASGPPTADTGFPAAVHSGELFTEPAGQAPANLAGWQATGKYGISLAGGTYADNGAIPDQALVGFLEGPGALSQTVAGLTSGTDYELSFAYNAKGGTSPTLQVTVADEVLFEETVAAVGGAAPYRTKTVSFTAADATATITFAQTEETDETLLLDDVRLVGKVIQDMPLSFDPTGDELAPTQRLTIEVTVPEEYLAGRAIDLQLATDRPDRAQLVGTDINGILTLSFAQGGPNVQEFEIEAVSTGKASVTTLNLADYPGLIWPQSVAVDVVSSFVRNSSFESSPVPAGVGEGTILAWTGGSGLNAAGGPFADNGIIPDRAQVAFLQGAQTLSQEIFGLSPGKSYWLQFRYNARAFGGTTIDLSVRFAGVELEKLSDIAAVGVAPGDVPYNFMSLRFTPGSSTGLLEFVTTTEPAADATLLLDAVSIVQRDEDEVLIENPSFEASGSPTGIGYAAPISGWALTCGGGINIGILPFGPFSDNGVAPDQDRVLFLQQNCRMAQFISGLVPGEEYTLTYAFNRRYCCDAPTDPPTPPVLFHSVSFGDVFLLSDEEVLPAGLIGETFPYAVNSLTFEAPAAEGELAFTTTVLGDASFLIDDVHIRPAGLQEICDNDVDDDGDDKIDCADEDCASAPGCQGKKFYRADPNNDGSCNITDGIYILNFLFLGGPTPTCKESADANNDRTVNITDGIYVLNYLFLGGPAPLPPGPPGKGAPCGPDTDAAGSAGDLGCDVYDKC